MEAASRRWPGLGYEQVRGLSDRLISRYLRTQRRGMRRFFAENGFYHLAARMDEIRRSRQGMLAKNQMFQEVLNAYAVERTRETTPVAGDGSVVLQRVPVPADDGADSGGSDAGASVQALAPDGSAGPVIEE